MTEPELDLTPSEHTTSAPPTSGAGPLDIDFSSSTDSSHDAQDIFSLSTPSHASAPRRPSTSIQQPHELADLKAQVESLSSQKEQQTKRHSEEIATLTRERDDLLKQGSSGGTTSEADLKTQMAALQKRLNESLEKQEHLEAEVLFHKKRYEHTMEKLNKEKDFEIQKLKATFQEWAGKRKKDFLALQWKLKAAAEAGKKLSVEKAELTKQVASYKQKAEEQESTISELVPEKKRLLLEIEKLNAQLSQVNPQLDELSTRLAEKEKEVEVPVEEKVMKVEANWSGNATIVPAQQPMTGKSIKVQPEFTENYEVQWYRSFRGSYFYPIPGVFGKEETYVPTVDDVGAVLRAECTCHSTGQTAAAEIGPVACRPKVVGVVAEHLKKMDVTYPLLVNPETQPKDKGKNLTVLLNKEKIKLRMDGRTFSKAPYNKNLRVVLDGSSPVKLAIKANETEKQYDFLCRNSLERDALTITIRLINQLQMMGKARPPDTTVALLEWIRNTNTSEEIGVVDSKGLRDIKVLKEKDSTWATSNGRSRSGGTGSSGGGGSNTIRPPAPDRGRSLSHSQASSSGTLQKSPSRLDSTRSIESQDDKETGSTSASGRHQKSLSVSDGSSILPLDIFADMIPPTNNTPTNNTSGSQSSTPGKHPPSTPSKNRSGAPATSPIPEEREDSRDDGRETSKNSTSAHSEFDEESAATTGGTPSKNKEKPKEKEKPKDKGKENDKNKDKGKENDKNKDKAKENDKNKDKGKDKAKEKGKDGKEKPVRRDSKGFIIDEERRGFSSNFADEEHDGNASDDSGFGSEEEAPKPKINIKIDMDKPKIASAEELKAVTLGVGLTLGASPRVGVKSSKSSTRSKKGGVKKEKKKKEGKKPKKGKDVPGGSEQNGVSGAPGVVAGLGGFDTQETGGGGGGGEDGATPTGSASENHEISFT